MSTSLEFQLTGLPVPGAITKKMFSRARRAMLTWSNAYLHELVLERMSGDPGVNRRTGNLSRDWVVSVDGDSLSSLSTTVKTQGTANAYAGALEYGADINPKTAQNLWIPMPDNLTDKGVAKTSPTEAIDAGGYYVHDDKDGLVFMGVYGKGTAPVALFHLVKHVHIDPKLGAGDLFQSKLPELADMMAIALEGAWSGGNEE